MTNILIKNDLPIESELL